MSIGTSSALLVTFLFAVFAKPVAAQRISFDVCAESTVWARLHRVAQVTHEDNTELVMMNLAIVVAAAIQCPGPLTFRPGIFFGVTVDPEFRRDERGVLWRHYSLRCLY